MLAASSEGPSVGQAEPERHVVPCPPDLRRDQFTLRTATSRIVAVIVDSTNRSVGETVNCGTMAAYKRA